MRETSISPGLTAGPGNTCTIYQPSTQKAESGAWMLQARLNNKVKLISISMKQKTAG